MAVQSEFWTNYIIDRLYKDNQFLNYAFSDDQYVVGGKKGKIVHIQNPGTKPVVVKNRAVFPGVAVQRTDNDITYTLDAYTTDPTHIVAADLMEISYPKIESVFGDHAGYLVETVADDMILKWLASIAAPNIIATTGPASSTNNVTGQVGTRKGMVAADLKSIQKRMNLDNVPKKDRYVLLESNMLDELTESLNITQNRDFSEAYDAKAGVVGQLYGFKVMERSNVAIASSADAIAALGAAVGATDNVVSIAWQKDCVARALGDRKFFENKDDALYYGDVYSALLRAGGRRRRTDNTGVVALIKKP
ncbi:MAG: hypothetical protein HOP30_21755 [Cyclobacteriaceae bacterium]|nr:hypothetical protein [Cyclobacteriaceae bacterium]